MQCRTKEYGMKNKNLPAMFEELFLVPYPYFCILHSYLS